MLDTPQSTGSAPNDPSPLDPPPASPPTAATTSTQSVFSAPSPAQPAAVQSAATYPSATAMAITPQQAALATFLMPLPATGGLSQGAAAHQLLQLTNAAQLLQLGNAAGALKGAGIAAPGSVAAVQQQQQQLVTAIAAVQQQQQQAHNAAAAAAQQQQQQQAAAAAAAASVPASAGALLTEVALKLQPQHSLTATAPAIVSPRPAGSRQVKLLVSSGGAFQRSSASGCWSYTGGETRLVSTHLHGTFQQLLADLSRASSNAVDATCSLKYELPGTPDQLVDLKTDDDVDNMWEEWQAHCELVRKPTFKLRLYVQQVRPHRTSSGEVPSPTRRSLDTSSGFFSSSSSTGSSTCDAFPPSAAAAPASPSTPSRTSLDDAPPRQPSDSSSTDISTPLTTIAEAPSPPGPASPCAASPPPPPAPTPQDPLAAASLALTLPVLNHDEPPEVTVADLLKLESKFEVISPDAIHITRALGEGIYGEVYMGTWMDVEVAVKCLNTALFNPPGWRGPPGSMSPNVLASMVEEANALVSFRHPNIVWMYGVVLPSIDEVIAHARLAAHAPAEPAAAPAAEPAAAAAEPAAAPAAADAGAAEAGCEGAHAAPPRTAVQLADATTGAVGLALPPSVPPAAADAGLRGAPSGAGSGLNGMELDECGLPKCIRPPAKVVEYMSGRSLRGCLVRGEEFMKNPMVRVKIALDAARGMAYLHSKHRPHLDLKSSNIIVGFRDRQPIAKVADFAQTKHKMRSFLSPGKLAFMKNTLPWVAPELLHGLPPAGLFSADVYSFGIVLWELWVCHMPYTDLNNQQLLDARLANPNLRPPLPGSFEWEAEVVPPEPGPGWSDLMQECWAAEPTARPSFHVVVERLQGVLAALKAKRRNVVTA